MHEPIPYDQTGKPGSWRDTYLRDTLSSRCITVTCPKGHESTLHIQHRSWPSKNHTIARDGEVNPSVQCPHNCDWHVFIRLENWNPEWNE